MIDIKKIRTKTKQKIAKTIVQNEQLRILELNMSISILKKYFADKPEINIFIFGSLTRKYQFTPNSDIDIAVENFIGSRLDLFLDLEKLFKRKIDLVILEKTSFKSEIIKTGIKIQ